MPTTSRLSLRYPAATDSADVPRDIGYLASDLDKAAIFSKGLFSARPTSTVGSPGIDGRYFFATDTSRLYLDTGTSWVEVASGTGSVTSAMIADGAVAATDLASALGMFGSWSYYTPNLTASTTSPTLGSGSTATGRYVQIGRFVAFHAFIQFGTSGVAAGSGIYGVSLPVAAPNSIYGATGTQQASFTGVTELKAGSSYVYANTAISTTTASIYYTSAYPSGTQVTVGAGNPWTWAASNIIHMSGWYEANANAA